MGWFSQTQSLRSWGPLIAHFVISSVSITNVWMIMCVLPPTETLFNLFMCLFFLMTVWFTEREFVASVWIGPGFVPFNWQPANKHDARYLIYCHRCDGYKAPRAHHCSKCDRCVMKMDHHCPFIATCVGHYNQSHFIKFLVSAILGCSHASGLLGLVVYQHFMRAMYFNRAGQPRSSMPTAFFSHPLPLVLYRPFALIAVTFSCGMAIGTAVVLSVLLYYQLKSVALNMTPFEEWIVDKSSYHLDPDTGRIAPTRPKDEWHYPYDLSVGRNFRELLFNSQMTALGNGLDEWIVRPECTKYDLTIEQLRQKRLKRLMAQRFRAVKPYNGRWWPVWSQGPVTALCFPWTDETRIPLSCGEIINVINWNRRWMYGVKLDEHGETTYKGWFPRNCVQIVPDDEPIDSQATCTSRGKKLLSSVTCRPVQHHVSSGAGVRHGQEPPTIRDCYISANDADPGELYDDCSDAGSNHRYSDDDSSRADEQSRSGTRISDPFSASDSEGRSETQSSMTSHSRNGSGGYAATISRPDPVVGRRYATRSKVKR